MNKVLKLLLDNIELVALYFFSVLLFTFLLAFVRTDIIIHIRDIEYINAHNISYPSNFAFYWIINALSCFSSIRYLELFNTINILSLATVFKYAISKKIIFKLNKFIFRAVQKRIIIILALSLFFCFAIPDPFSIFVLKKYFVGRFVPIVWHNSTTILLFPFAILLFWKQLLALNSSESLRFRDFLILSGLIILNVIIKPSFLLVYLPITFIFTILKYKNKSLRFQLINLSPVFFGIILILLQTFLIYYLELGVHEKMQSQIAIGPPFKILSYYIPIWYIPISLLFSYLLPICSILLYKEIIFYKPFLYALSLSIMGIIICSLIYETGPRMYHGNFFWQTVICSYLLFLTCISFLVPKIIGKVSWSFKEKVIILLIFLHTLSGVLYPIKMILTFSYF